MDYNIEIENLIGKSVTNIKNEIVAFNDGIPIFQKSDYEIIEGNPIYFELDKYGRSIGAIALLSKNTIPLVVKKKLIYPNPHGWNKNFEGKYLFERCHIISYSLSAKLADKRNLFIGTRNLNKSIMIKIENRVKNYIMQNNVRVLYRVTVKYKGKNQIPTGILIEAKSLDDEFSVCEFCYNIQKGVKFKYSDGAVIEDKRILPKIKQRVNKITGNNNKRIKDKITEKNKNYIINRKTNEFHIDKECEGLKKIELKYINETTAVKRDLLNANLIPCKKCN